jgi:Ca2+-binding RTX toxin-like protein
VTHASKLEKRGGALAGLLAMLGLVAPSPALADGAVSRDDSALIYVADAGDNAPIISTDFGEGEVEDMWHLKDSSEVGNVPIIPTPPCEPADSPPRYPDDYYDAYCPKVGTTIVHVVLGTGRDGYNHAESGNYFPNPLQTIPLHLEAGPGSDGTFDQIGGGLLGDLMRGEGGNDVMWGREGNDNVLGNEGKDHLDGGEGDDILKGGPGRDHLFDFTAGSADRDVVICGPGADKAKVDKKDDQVDGCEKVKRVG